MGHDQEAAGDHRVCCLPGPRTWICGSFGALVDLPLGAPASFVPNFRFALSGRSADHIRRHWASRFIRSFRSEGVGTPAPVFPTRDLIVTGLYRYVRNPMYIAVVSTILGQV